MGVEYIYRGRKVIQLIMNESPHDKAYNNTHGYSKLRSAPKSTQYSKASRLSIFG